jgi:hypothetical protein
MLTDKINNTSSKPSEFFGKLFQLRDQIHLTHLAVKGSGAYAAHMALGSYYDSLLDIIDTLVESYQGKYGVLTLSIPSSTKVEPIAILKELAKLTDGGSAYGMFKETWIQNIIDEISALTYQTIYKLENLK